MNHYFDYDFDYDEFQEDDLLTNFESPDLNLYEQAIKEFNDETLFISDKAYDCKGNLIKNCYSLRTAIDCERSEFWKLFHEIEKRLNENKNLCLKEERNRNGIY